MHTTNEGIILLDVTEQASWVAPLIEACTNTKPAKGQIWVLPEDTLIQLILGMNTLIAHSEIVLAHEFHIRGIHGTGTI